MRPGPRPGRRDRHDVAGARVSGKVASRPGETMSGWTSKSSRSCALRTPPIRSAGDRGDLTVRSDQREIFWQNGPWHSRCLIRPYGRSCLQPGAGAVGQPWPEIVAGAGLELGGQQDDLALPGKSAGRAGRGCACARSRRWPAAYGGPVRRMRACRARRTCRALCAAAPARRRAVSMDIQFPFIK